MSIEPGFDPRALSRAKQDLAHGLRTFARYLQRRADEGEIEQCRLLLVRLAEEDGSGAKEESSTDFSEDRKRRTLLISVANEALVLKERASGRLRFLQMAGEISGEEIGKKTAAVAENFRLLREAGRKSFFEVRERLVSMEKEHLSTSAGRFAAAEAEGLTGDLHEILCRSRWAPVFRAARRFAKYASAEIARDIDDWAKQEVQRLNSELPRRFRDEWARVQKELCGIPSDGNEILRAARCIHFHAGENLERTGRERLPPPVPARMEWKLPLRPATVVFAPLRIGRSRAEKQIFEQMSRFLAAFTRSAEENLLSAVRYALDGLGAEVEKRAAEREREILDALAGKRSLRGIDGQFHTVGFKGEEIAGEMILLAGIEKRLASVRRELLGAKPASNHAPLDEPTETNGPPGVESRFEFDEDLKTRGCAVCNRMAAEAGRFLADRQYALSTRESARREFADSLGFCPIHMWQLETLGSPHGLSLGLSAFTEKLSAELARLAREKEPGRAESIRRLARPSRICAACRLLKEVEDKYLVGMAGFLEIIEAREAYALSQGLCLRHLGMLVAKTTDEETLRFLLDHASRIHRQLTEDMLNYALKRDAVRSDLLNDDEKDAYLRAIIHTSGGKISYTPEQV